MVDLKKEFSRKTSQYFRDKNIKSILIPGSSQYADMDRALSAAEVILFMRRGQDEMKNFAEKKGYTNADSAYFYIESWVYTMECSVEEYNDADQDVECFYLIAVPAVKEEL